MHWPQSLLFQPAISKVGQHSQFPPRHHRLRLLPKERRQRRKRQFCVDHRNAGPALHQGAAKQPVQANRSSKRLSADAITLSGLPGPKPKQKRLCAKRMISSQALVLIVWSMVDTGCHTACPGPDWSWTDTCFQMQFMAPAPFIGISTAGRTPAPAAAVGLPGLTRPVILSWIVLRPVAGLRLRSGFR